MCFYLPYLRGEGVVLAGLVIVGKLKTGSHFYKTYDIVSGSVQVDSHVEATPKLVYRFIPFNVDGSVT